MLTDLVHIARIGRQKRDENFRFRAYLKNHRHSDRRLRRFGEEAAAAPNGVAAQLPEGVSDLAEIVRTLDAEGLRIADLRLHSPTLDDVFLAKTGRSLEGAGDDDGDAGDGDVPKDERKASAAPVGS